MRHADVFLAVRARVVLDYGSFLLRMSRTFRAMEVPRRGLFLQRQFQQPNFTVTIKS